MDIVTKPKLFLLLLFLSFISFSPGAYADVPIVDHVMVTDVTTRSFSVIWAASEASTATLEVYEDTAGTMVVSGAVITPHPVNSGNAAIQTAAEGLGVMKVMVTGLEPNATYYFKTITTSKSSSDFTVYPDAAPFMGVTTETSTVRAYESNGDVYPFSNDLIIEDFFTPSGPVPPSGSIILATLEGGDHPITAFVGDGVTAPAAVLDLNNVFSSATKENLDLTQGLNLTLLNFRGIQGYSIVTHEVPLDEDLSEVKPGEFALMAGENFVSFQLEPDMASPEDVLSSILPQVESIWGFDPVQKWIFWSPDPAIPAFLKKLSALHSSTGYWLLLNDAASWTVEGVYNPGPVSLNDGENLVGYNSIETLDVQTATQSIITQVESIWTKDSVQGWIFWNPDPAIPAFLKKLKVVEPGKAYYVIVDGACDWQCNLAHCN